MIKNTIDINIIVNDNGRMKIHKLKIYRQKKRLSREKLRGLLGIKSTTTIYNWERWAVRPSPTNALAVENLTDGEITTRYMLYG